MESLCIVTSREIHRAQLREFVESRGGYWNSEETLDQGVIERRKAAVFVSATNRLDRYYDPDELAQIEEELRDPPKTLIEIDVGHGKGSWRLAREVVREMIGQWGGYFDDNGLDVSID